MSDTESIAEMIHEYRELLVERTNYREKPDIANKLWDRNHTLYKRLRASEEGRAAISNLLDDENIPVRLTAATHCLVWETGRAICVLEDLETLNDKTLYGFTAKYVLIEFRNGTLDVDW